MLGKKLAVIRYGNFQITTPIYEGYSEVTHEIQYMTMKADGKISAKQL